MAQGINKVILVGNCGQDPDTKFMPNGNAVTNISIATSESWKDKQTGQQQERTEWHKVVFFNRLGEIAGEYLRKGSKVYIEGSLRTRKWQDQSGQDRYTTEIVASEMQMLDSRGDNAGMGAGNNMGGGFQPQAAPQAAAPQAGGFQPQQPRHQPQAPQSQHTPQAAPQMRPQPQAAPQMRPPAGFNDFDDDIPFMRMQNEYIY